jgi:hypothetical protein
MTMMYVVHCVYVYYRRPLPVALSTFSAPLHTSQQRVSNNLTTLLASTVVVIDSLIARITVSVSIPADRIGVPGNTEAGVGKRKRQRRIK